jgi:hypothetical protein
MPNGPTHLSDEQLARYQDGESAAGDSHVEVCEECAGRLRDMRAAFAAYSEYRDTIRNPQLPPVPKPWRGLDQLVADHESQRRKQVLLFWAPALAAAVSLFVLVAVGLRTKGEDSQRASQLLERAALVSMPEDRMISMRVHGRTLVRPAVLMDDAGAGSDSELAHLRGLFQEAHYGWQDLLNPRTFQAWRKTHRDGRDSVSLITRAGEPRMYRVRTVVPAGVLRSASLTLQAEDLRPTGGDFEFEGEGAVSIEEAPAPVTPTQSASSSPSPREAPVETPVGPADTLHVLAALDEIGADVAEPINVTEDASHSHVVVRAAGLSPERRQAVLTALAPLPRVTLELQPPTRQVTTPPAATSQSYSSDIPSELRQRFEDRLGGPAALQEVTDRVLEASAQSLARAHAMQVLAGDFPPGIESGMNSQDRLLLRQLERRHVGELERLVKQIRAALGPILGGPDAASQPVGDNRGGQTWQAGIPSLVASAQETDQLLNHLLAGSYSQSSGEEMLRSLTPSLQRLEWAVQFQSKAAQSKSE